MAFERIQTEIHMTSDDKVVVYYDRITTRFHIKHGDTVVYSSYLIFLPFRKDEIIIGNQAFILKIRWFILWQSKLLKNDNVIIKELLSRRRKKSIGLFIYFLLASTVKVGIGLIA